MTTKTTRDFTAPSAGRQRALAASRRMLSVAACLLVLSFGLFLIQLVNFGTFRVKANGSESLPVSIRASSQADYSAEARASSIPPVDENILRQIVQDIPATGAPWERMSTVQAALLSPVPTMTRDHRFPATSTLEPVKTSTNMSPTSTAPTVRGTSIVSTQFVAPTPTALSFDQTYLSPAPTFTAPPKQATKTRTPSATATSSKTQTPASANTITATKTPTFTVTPTFTHTATGIPSSTYTNTATASPTSTPTATVTSSATQTPTPTHTATGTPTATVTPSQTASPTHTVTQTATLTPSSTSTQTATSTSTETLTHTPTNTLTFTHTATLTETATATMTPTLTSTFTSTSTPTWTPSSTYTPTLTFTPTFTLMPSSTPTPGSPACYPGTPNGLLPSDDTYISGDAQLNNFGSQTTLEVRPDNGGDRRGLIKFDLSAIPSNATITSATLYLYQKDNKTGQTTSVYRVTSDWSEDSVTWLSWLLLGGDFDASISYFTFLPDQVNCMLTMDITNLAQLWVNGTYPNHGLMLYATGPNHKISYVTKEDQAAGEWPRLDIVYTTP